MDMVHKAGVKGDC